MSDGDNRIEGYHRLPCREGPPGPLSPKAQLPSNIRACRRQGFRVAGATWRETRRRLLTRPRTHVLGLGWLTERGAQGDDAGLGPAWGRSTPTEVGGNRIRYSARAQRAARIAVVELNAQDGGHRRRSAWEASSRNAITA